MYEDTFSMGSLNTNTEHYFDNPPKVKLLNEVPVSRVPLSKTLRSICTII